MSKSKKIKGDSYWSIRRRVHSNVDDHIRELSESQIDLEFDASNNVALPFNSEDSQGHFETDRDISLIDYDLTCNQDEDGVSNFNFTHLSSDSESEQSRWGGNEQESFSDHLREWATKFQIPHNALSELLTILKPFFPSLPKDPRTLLQTKVQYNISDTSGGQYYHFGIVNGIKLNIGQADVGMEIQLQINIDGLPLFKSSSDQFWPILGRVMNIKDKSPFIIGLFHGTAKPNNVHDYLKEFVQDCLRVTREGFMHMNKEVKVSISSFVCDTPARAFIKNVKQYSGYHGCDKCIQNGVWLNKVTYPEVDAQLRTDLAFDEMLDEDHHKGESPLKVLKVGMVSQFPLDYMHLVCLGVMKRMFLLWIKGPLNIRLGSRVILQMSSYLLRLKHHIPCEFSRKPRSVAELDRWKATEFRQFLLYTGPIVLARTIPRNIYKNFMLLSVAIRILINEKLCKKHSNYAKELLVTFVKHFYELYGYDQAVYNVHGLVHLANDALKYNGLDNISSFPFENFLKSLKHLVRKPSFPLQQVIRRITEGLNIKSSSTHLYPILRKQHVLGPVPPNLQNGVQYRSVELDQIFLKVNGKDNCIMIDDKVGLIKNIISFESDIYIIYQTFSRQTDFFDSPLPSSLLHIYQLSHLKDNLFVSKLSDIQSKCVLFPDHDRFVSVPFANTL